MYIRDQKEKKKGYLKSNLILTMDIDKHENDHQEPHERAVREKKNSIYDRSLTSQENILREKFQVKLLLYNYKLTPDSNHSFEVIIQ